MKYLYWFVQTLMWPAAWVLIRIFYRVEIKGRKNLKNLSGPLIIVSNHKTLFDAWLIGIALPFASRFFPLRFMTEEIRFHGPVLEFLRRVRLLQFFYRLSGGFPSYRGEGIEKALQTPLELLAKGGTVLMFPEGKLVREDGLGTFYPGTAALALKSGVPILPFFIQIQGRKISVKIGLSFRLFANGIDEGTEIIRRKIENLNR